VSTWLQQRTSTRSNAAKLYGWKDEHQNTYHSVADALACLEVVTVPSLSRGTGKAYSIFFRDYHTLSSYSDGEISNVYNGGSSGNQFLYSKKGGPRNSLKVLLPDR